MRQQLYLVWSERNGAVHREDPVLHVKPHAGGPRPEMRYDYGLRVIRASSPARAARRYVDRCLPLVLYVAEDGPNEMLDITHLKPGPRAAELRLYRRIAKRVTRDDRGRVKFQLHTGATHGTAISKSSRAAARDRAD